MDTSIRSGTLGALFALAATCSLVLAGATPLKAETIATINGVDIDSALVDFYLESRTQRPAAQASADERDAVIRELTDIYLLTTQPVAEELAKGARIKAQIELQERAIIAQAVAQDFISKHQASEEEILAEYEQQIALAPPLQFKARHILVETQAAATDLVAQLQDGADFIELAKANSTGPSGPNGGDLGWFSPEQMVAPFSAAVAALEDGEFTTEPVQTQFGWHVILREESRSNEPPTLESVRPVIKQNIEQTKLRDFIEQLRSDQ